MAVNSRQGTSGLRRECLSFPETLAQSIGDIAPVAMPSVNITLVFASAGKGTWLAFLIATVGLVFVSLNINHFARRSASPGTLYGSIAWVLGPIAGILAGWALSLAYLLTAMAVSSGFVLFTNVVLGEFGLQAPPILLYAVCASIVWYYAYTDIQLSTVLMLILEISSVSLILVLAFFVLLQHGFTIDTSQILLTGVSPEGIRLGLVLAIFSYVGFESATVLGDEAKRPLQFIPRAVIWSTVLSGLFYIFISYTEVLGFSGYQTPLNKIDVPLSVLANLTGVELLGVAISAGVTFSFFTCTLANINAGARIFFSMSRYGIFHSALGEAHAKNETPHVAVSVSALLLFLVPASISLFGVPALDIYGYLATIATYGFLLVYILISVAAPVELFRRGRLRPSNVAIAVLAILFMLIPVIGSVYPIPPAPYNVFPYLFLMYLVVGAGWFMSLYRRSPQMIEDMTQEFKAIHSKFNESEVD